MKGCAKFCLASLVCDCPVLLTSTFCASAGDGRAASAASSSRAMPAPARGAAGKPRRREEDARGDRHRRAAAGRAGRKRRKEARRAPARRAAPAGAGAGVLPRAGALAPVTSGFPGLSSTRAA